MYAGRVEHAKGVFDLLAVARNLYARGRRDVVFEVCGDGSALPELRAEVARYGLQDTFTLRGWCGHKEMRESLSRAHVVVAPTRREFAEGFNMVIVEALLAGRPVISSRACPALEYVTRGVIEVPSDDMAGYQNAIVSLADDRPRYRELQQGSLASGARFLREDTSFGAALVHCLRAIARGEPVRPRPIDPRAI